MVNQTSKDIHELILSSNQQQSIDFQTEFSSLTLSIIASSALDWNIDTIKNDKEIINQRFTTLLEAM